MRGRVGAQGVFATVFYCVRSSGGSHPWTRATLRVNILTANKRYLVLGCAEQENSLAQARCYRELIDGAHGPTIRKHGISEDAGIYVAEHHVYVADLDDDNPARPDAVSHCCTGSGRPPPRAVSVTSPARRSHQNQ